MTYADRISIQVSLSGYSFRIQTGDSTEYSGWLSPDRIFTTKEFQSRHGDVEISLFTPKCTLVPSHFFSVPHSGELLADVSELEDGDSVDHVEIPWCDAVLVGAGTVKVDNPALTVRRWHAERQPLRVVLDGRLSIPADCNLLSDGLPTIVYNNEKSCSKDSVEYVKIDLSTPAAWLADLYSRNITSVMIEGGACVLNEMIEGSKLRILPGYKHGELSLRHPEEYVALLVQMIDGKL